MGWFKRNKRRTLDDPITQTEKALASIEIVTDASARKQVVEDAKKANETLNRLLVENGFTVKIFLATGGKHPHSEGAEK